MPPTACWLPSHPCWFTGTTMPAMANASIPIPAPVRCRPFSAPAGRPRTAGIFRARLDVSLILYAEHEFNASTFTSRVISGTGSDIYSAVTGAIGALRGYKHGGANEGAFELIQRFRNADEAEQGIQRCWKTRRKSWVLVTRSIPYPIPAPTSSKPMRASCAKSSAPRSYSKLPSGSSRPCGISKRLIPQSRFLQCGGLPCDGYPDPHVYPAVCHVSHYRLDSAYSRTAFR
jgi:hypothetical protein